jgi:hypothetical protein
MRNQPASTTGNPDLPRGPAIRPGVALLIYHIGKALLVEGRALLAIVILAAIALHLVELDNKTFAVLAGTGLVLLALVRGCIDWQKDLAGYQQALALQRHRTGLEDLIDPMQRLASRHQ